MPTEEEDDDEDDWLVLLVSDAIVDVEISDSVIVAIPVPSVLVKVWAELVELNVGDDDEIDWEVEMVSYTSSLEREIELLVWIVVSVGNVDCDELISGSDMVTISVVSVVTIEGTLGVIDDWLIVLDWVNVDSDSDIVSSSPIVVVDVYIGLVLWRIVLRVPLISVSDIVSKVKKIICLKCT